MKTLQFSIQHAILFLSCFCLAQSEYGQFTEAECFIKISEELSTSGNFTTSPAASCIEGFKKNQTYIIP